MCHLLCVLLPLSCAHITFRMCRTLYSLYIAMHVQSKLGAHSQLIGPRCIGIHQDHRALWEMVCAKMRKEVNLYVAQAMVMVVGL